MQKKYLLISLVTATALLSGCSATAEETYQQDHSAISADESGVGSNGLINPSDTEPTESDISPTTFEDGAVEIVKLPASLTESKDFIEPPLGEVSGSIVEGEEETIVVYNTYQGPEIRQWVQDLGDKGWQKSEIDTLDNATSYVTLLTKDGKTISLYSTNTTETKNTVVSFSK